MNLDLVYGLWTSGPLTITQTLKLVLGPVDMDIIESYKVLNLKSVVRKLQIHIRVLIQPSILPPCRLRNKIATVLKLYSRFKNPNPRGLGLKLKSHGPPSLQT